MCVWGGGGGGGWGGVVENIVRHPTTDNTTNKNIEFVQRKAVI